MQCPFINKFWLWNSSDEVRIFRQSILHWSDEHKDGDGFQAAHSHSPGVHGWCSATQRITIPEPKSTDIGNISSNLGKESDLVTHSISTVCLGKQIYHWSWSFHATQYPTLLVPRLCLGRENIHNGWNHKKAFLKFVEKEGTQCSNISFLIKCACLLTFCMLV